MNTGNANTPHTHPVSLGTANAPHSHPASVTTATVPHSHTASDNATSSQHIHAARHRRDDPGSGANADWNAFGSSASFTQGNTTPGANAGPHDHNFPGGGTSNFPHSHPVTLSAANMLHAHTANSGNTNMTHTHPVPSNPSANAPHNHPLSVGAQNFPHSHTTNVGTTNIPHSHPGSVMGNFGSGDSFSIEPKYIECVYVMRVR